MLSDHTFIVRIIENNKQIDYSFSEAQQAIIFYLSHPNSQLLGLPNKEE